jgi:hypothetical protein
MNTKKSQLKIMETVFILIIFFILLMIGLIFYSNIEANSLAKINELDQQRNMLKFAISISNFPELSCTELTSELSEGCFDLYKIRVFSQLREDDEFKRDMILNYFDLFGDSVITIREVFPDKAEFMIFNKTLDGSKDIKYSFIPVIVRDPADKKDIFAYLEIRTYK